MIKKLGLCSLIFLLANVQSAGASSLDKVKKEAAQLETIDLTHSNALTLKRHSKAFEEHMFEQMERKQAEGAEIFVMPIPQGVLSKDIIELLQLLDKSESMQEKYSVGNDICKYSTKFADTSDEDLIRLAYVTIFLGLKPRVLLSSMIYTLVQRITQRCNQREGSLTALLNAANLELVCAYPSLYKHLATHYFYKTDFRVLKDDGQKFELCNVSIAELLAYNKIEVNQQSREIKLDNRSIDCVDGLELIPGFPNIRDLDLSNNCIEELPRDFPVYDLWTLRLGCNRIKKLPRNMLRGKHQLRQLWLGTNQLTELDEDVFNDCSELRFLFLGANQLETIPATLGKTCPVLQRLIISGNRMNRFQDGCLSSHQALEELVLGGNCLSTFPEAFLSDCPRLKGAYFGGNTILKLPQLIFAKSPQLGDLCLGSNELKELPQTVVALLPALKILTVDHNRLPQAVLEIIKRDFKHVNSDMPQKPDEEIKPQDN